MSGCVGLTGVFDIVTDFLGGKVDLLSLFGLGWMLFDP